jgi:hypothetical protein
MLEVLKNFHLPLFMNKCIKIGVSLQLTLLISLPEAGDSKATKQEEAKGDIDFFGPQMALA